MSLAQFVFPWLVVCLGCWLLIQLFRQNGRLLLRLDALEQKIEARPDEVQRPLAPDFELSGLDGTRRRLSEWRGRRVLLVFFKPGTKFCEELAPELAALPVGADSRLPLPVIVSTGDAAENRRLVERFAMRCPVLLQERAEVAISFNARALPSAVLVDERGRVASKVVVGGPGILALAHEPTLAQSRDGRAGGGLQDGPVKAAGLPPGTPAPAFSLPDLQGRNVSLQDYLGQRVVVVFTDPDCGPCRALAPDLASHGREDDAVPLLMVSRGDARRNRKHLHDVESRFPVLLQKGLEVSRSYSLFMTPSACLIDEHGKVAAASAVGADAILELIEDAGRAERM
jgi:peroxiredoxin